MNKEKKLKKLGIPDKTVTWEEFKELPQTRGEGISFKAQGVGDWKGEWFWFESLGVVEVDRALADGEVIRGMKVNAGNWHRLVVVPHNFPR